MPASQTAIAPALREPIDILRSSLLRISRLVRQAGMSPLSLTEMTLLVAIRHNPGIGVSELAEKERTTRATMSIHVKHLETAGWVERRAVPSDGRRSELRLTAAGTQLLRETGRRGGDWLETRIAHLPTEAQDRLWSALDALQMLAESGR